MELKQLQASRQLFEIRLIENVLEQSNIQKFQLKLQTIWISSQKLIQTAEQIKIL